MSQPQALTPAAQPSSLSEAWAQAERDIRHTQSPPPATTPTALISLHSTALHSLLALRQLVQSAGVVSANDELSELPTSSLRYLLVPSLLAGVLQSWPGMDGRRGRLEQCTNLWRQLLTAVDVMEGLTESEERRWKQVKAATGAGNADEEADSSGGRVDAGQQRQDKIARFKQQREWEQQIEAYEARRQQRQDKQSSHRGATTTAAAADDGEEGEADDEAARDYWLLRLRVAVGAAMDELLTAQQELEFLKERQARESNAQYREQREREDEEKQAAGEGHKPVSYTISSSAQLRSQPIPPHMQSYLQPLPPGAETSGGGAVTTLEGLMGRGRREDVFRVVNGPTMSVEEWAEREMREGRLPTPQQPWRAATREQRGYVGTGDGQDGSGGGGGGGAGAGGEEEDDVGQVGGEGDERRADAKREEEREWDNWKDDHERGAGNRER